MKLPNPPAQYDAANEASFRSEIEREDARNLKRGGNVLIGKGALVLTAPNGSLWQIAVSNSGVLTAVAYALP